MSARLSVAVIGLGGTGSAAARELSDAGHEVTAFEQHEPGHGRGSSHGESRIIRHAYSDTLYSNAMLHAWPLWLDLQERAGEELLVPCGGLTIGPPDHPEVRGVRAALAACGQAHEILDPREAERRFPALRFAKDEIAVLERGAGFLRASRCVLANVRLAREAGCDVIDSVRVLSLERARDRVIVHLEGGGELAVDRAIVAAGPWTARLVPALAPSLRVTWQQVVYLRAGGDRDHLAPSRLPVWIDGRAHDYGFPSDGAIEGIKVAAHVPGPEVDPEQASREPDVAREAGLVERSLRRVPQLTTQVTHALACLYTSTPDEDFVVDRVPSVEGAWVVSGCSGHGFKFTALLGQIAARLATGIEPGLDLSRWRMR